MLYPPREMDSLPDHVTGCGHYYGESEQTPAIREAYWIAKEGTKGEHGAPVTSKEIRLKAAENWAMSNLSNGKLVQSLAESITEKNLPAGSHVKLCFGLSRNEAGGMNLIPMVLADALKTRLETALADSSITIECTPITKLNKILRNGFHPVSQLVDRSLFDASNITPGDTTILLDEDHLSGMTLAEMGSAITRQGGNILACATALSLKGGQHLRIQPATIAALEHALTEHSGGIDAPIETFSSALQSYGLPQGIRSLTNIEGLMLVAAIYPPEQAASVLPPLWQRATGVAWDDAVHTYCAGNDCFPLEEISNQPGITARDAIAQMESNYETVSRGEGKKR